MEFDLRNAMPLYRGMTREQIDLAYNNSAAVPGWTQLYADMQQASAAYLRKAEGLFNIRYGRAERTRFDWIDCGLAAAPSFIFIHGGYWQYCMKEDFAFIAEGLALAGFNVILAEYSLAPEAGMTDIVQEIGYLLAFLKDKAHDFRIGPHTPVLLSGHSAGGHLTALHADHPLLTHTMPISAITDLHPISLTGLNDKLQLTDLEIEEFSPIRHVKNGRPVAVHNGAKELPELIRHSLDYAQALSLTGRQVRYEQIDGRNHFDLLHEFSFPHGFLLNSAKRLITS